MEQVGSKAMPKDVIGSGYMNVVGIRQEKKSLVVIGDRVAGLVEKILLFKEMELPWMSELNTAGCKS